MVIMLNRAWAQLNMISAVALAGLSLMIWKEMRIFVINNRKNVSFQYLYQGCPSQQSEEY